MTLRPWPRCQSLQASQSGKLELRVCTNKTCKHQGSKQIHQFLADLHLEQVDIGETGCLGNCGNGPNVLLVGTKLAPRGTRLAHISTPARAASALKTFADVILDAQLVKATELRLAGNAAVRAGDLHKAIALYSEALDLQPSTGSHLLLSNRSAAKLAAGNAEGALADASSAIRCAPSDYMTAYVRRVEALLQLQRPTDALRELLLVGDRHPDYATTPEYRSLLYQVQR